MTIKTSIITLFSIVTLYIVSLVFSSPPQVLAVDYGLSINPPLLRVHIKPGKSITNVYKVENLSTTEKTLIASLIPFSEADHFGNPILNPKADAPWLSYFSLVNSQIKLDQPFTIAAGSSEQLILSLSIPETAPLRDIYATLLVSTYQNSLDTTLQGTSLRATIGSNLIITISSQAFPDTTLIIEDFFPTEGSFVKLGNLYIIDSLTPVKFTALVNNEGSFAAETKGIFRVTTAGNKPLYLEGILPVNVIAKSKRQLQSLSGETFKYEPSLSQMGFHQIALEIKTDNSNTISAIQVFFFPFKLSLGLLLALIIVWSIIKIFSNPKGDQSPIDNPSQK